MSDKREEEKSLSTEQLKNLNDTFIAIAGHKLLSPITVIKWNTELLEKYVPEDKKELLDAININNQKLHDLSEVLLGIVDFNSNDINIDTENVVDITQLVDEILSEFNTEIGEKELTFKCEISGNVKIRFEVSYLKELFRAVIKNAINYGLSKTTIKIVTDNKDKNLVFSVSGESIGINENDLDLIPSAFYRAKNAQLSEVKGYGLNLYYVKCVLAKLNGKMKARCSDGNYVSVELVIPTV